MNLWLTRLTLDPRHRAVHGDLRDTVRLHNRVMSMFPDGLGDSARLAAGVLFRVEHSPQGASIILQSAMAPDPANLPTGYAQMRTNDLTPFLTALREGLPVHYRIDGNASQKLGRFTEQGKPGSVKVLSGADAEDWWARKAAAAGLALRSVHSTRQDGFQGNRKDGKRVNHAATRFEGLATVADAKALRETVQTGVGRGKAYACGLLSLAPAREAE
jgi:CRISPR system Cascade subunit CasE